MFRTSLACQDGRQSETETAEFLSPISRPYNAQLRYFKARRAAHAENCHVRTKAQGRRPRPAGHSFITADAASIFTDETHNVNSNRSGSAIKSRWISTVFGGLVAMKHYCITRVPGVEFRRAR